MIVELYDDPENIDKWQAGLTSFEPKSGKPGQPDAASRVNYRMGEREAEMIEMITVRHLPREVSVPFGATSVLNIATNIFLPARGGKYDWLWGRSYRPGEVWDSRDG